MVHSKNRKQTLQKKRIGKRNKTMKKKKYLKRKNIKGGKKNRIISSKTLRKNRNKNRRKNLTLKRKYMKGGNVSYTQAPGVNNQWMKGMKVVPPFTPPGGPYHPGSNTNGLGKGFYYKKSGDLGANADILTPNNKMNYPNKQNGGRLIPQDITNLGRNVVYGLQNAYTGFVGETLPSSSNPNPLYQPSLKKNMPLDYRSPDLNEIMSKSNKLAANYK